ncbi:MAG: lipopolysaccharide heptosyltransferase II [Phycisphaerae bacterium]
MGKPKARHKRIAVFLPNWVGDAVMATPALRALREHFAGDRIAYVARAAAAATLEGCPWADEVIVDKSGSTRSMMSGFFSLMFRLRRRRFHLAVLFPNSFRSALVARLGGVRKVIGYRRDGRGWLLSRSLGPPRNEAGLIPTSAIDYYNALAAFAGATAESHRMELPVSQAVQEQADALLREAGVCPGATLVMVNPGASFGTSKLWPPKRFAAVADALFERRGAAIIINAAPAERAIAAEVAAAMRNKPAVNFADRPNSIGLLKGLLRRCRLLITNDTGARHIGAAVGAAVVTIFGSTDPDWTVIHYGRERQVRTTVDCAPCQKKTCPQPAGPHYHQCMDAITPEQVLAAAEELLDMPEARV